MTRNPNDGKWRAAILKETQKPIWGLLFHWAFFIGAREKVWEKGGFHGRGQSEFTLKPCFYPGKAIQYERTLLNQQSGHLGLIWGNHHKLLSTCFLSWRKRIIMPPLPPSEIYVKIKWISKTLDTYMYGITTQVRVSGKSWGGLGYRWDTLRHHLQLNRAQRERQSKNEVEVSAGW